MKRKLPILDVLLVSALIILFFFYGYHNILPLRPQSPHHWRQSDGASVAWHYYDTTWNLFQPQIHNHITGEGKTAGEFPLIYYIVGLLYRLFGPHEWMFRLINILLFFGGLWALGRTVHLIMKDTFWAVFIPCLLFSSPILAYYANNFMPEPPALGLAMMGWYAFFLYREHSKQKHLYIALGLITLATMLKISVGISWVCLAAIYFIEWNDWTKYKQDRHIFHSPKWKFALYLAGSLVLIAGWYIYAKAYNRWNHVGYFRMETIPILDTNMPDYNFLLYRFATFYAETVFSPFTVLLVIFLMFFAWGSTGRKHQLLFTLSFLCFIGVLIYVLAFFQLFIIHDYFTTITFIFPLWLFVHSAYILQQDYPKLEQSWVFRGILIAFLIGVLIHAEWEVRKRYYGNELNFKEAEAFYDPKFPDFLEGLGIDEETLVISLPDISPNNTLYLMDREGWSGYNISVLPVHMDVYQREGAEYLIISDTNYMKKPELQQKLTQPLGQYKDVFVYKLPPLE